MKETPAAEEPSDPANNTLEVRTTFDVVLGPTYYRKGFFNVPAACAGQFGSDGDSIELYLGTEASAMLGTINRTANANQSPRIMGGVDLRDWFQRVGAEGHTLVVQVLSPKSARLQVR